MMQDGLGIDPAGSIDGAHLGQQRAKLVKRTEILRRPLQYIDKGELRFLPPVQRRQQHRALDFDRNAIDPGRTIRQLVIKLA